MRFAETLAVAAGRMRLAYALGVAGKTALGASVLYLAFVLVRRDVSPETVTYLWALAPLTVAVLALAVAYFLKSPAKFEVAKKVDLRLGLSESLSTAVVTATDAAGVAGPEWTVALAAQAERRASGLSPEIVRHAFRLPRPTPFAVALLLVVLAHVLPPRFGFPGKAAAAVSDQAALTKKKAAEAQRAREAARRLEARARDLARLAETKKLEAARAAAMKVAEDAKKLAANVDSKKDALSELSRMSQEVDRSKSTALGADSKSEAFKNPLDGDPLSELAQKLDQAAADDLAADLDKFAKDMRGEAKDAKAGGRAPRVDRRNLEDLMRRLQMAKDTLKRLAEAAKENGDLGDELERLSEEQRQLLDRIYKKLEKFASQCGGGQGGGEPLTEEELKEIAEFLESLSTDDLQKLMQTLRDGAAMEDLEELVDAARKETNGDGEKMSSARMADLLQRLSRTGKSGAPGDGEKSGEGQGGEQGQNAGHAESNGLGGHPGDPDAALREHVPGKVDPRGNKGQKVPFQGIPKPKDAKAAFDETVRRAAADAEEGLGRDRVPPALRPYVRRYFEALRKPEAEKK